MNVIITKSGIKVTDSDVIDSYQSIPSGSGGRLIAEDEPRASQWLKVLGEELADHLRENGFKIYKDQEVLLAFPKGYNLYCHATVSDNGKEQIETYLCGERKFCSPNEFASHLIWLVTGRSAPCKCIHCQRKKDNSESIIPSSPSTIKSDDSQEVFEAASSMQSLALSYKQPEVPLQASQPEVESSESSIISSPPSEEIEEPLSSPSSHENKSSIGNKGLKRLANDESFSKPDETVKKAKPSQTVPISNRNKNSRKDKSLTKEKKLNKNVRSQSSRNVTENRKSMHRENSVLKSNNNGKSRRYSKISKSSQKKHSNKVKTSPKKIQAEYRSGEIVWVCLSKTRNHELLKRINEESNNDISVEHWPGVIYSLNKDGDFVNFKVKLVVLDMMIDVRRNMMKPWKAYNPEIPEGLIQEVVGGKNYDLNFLAMNENTKDYVRAVHRAQEASNTYSPMKAYWPNEADNDRKPTHEILSEEGLSVEKDFAHYEYILFGAERIQEGDLVRLVPENSKYPDGEPEFPEFLEIKEIYDHRSEGIKLTGNILQRGELLNSDGPYRLEDYKWWISDDVDELFTVDLEDIAGRFYLMMPHVTKRTIAHIHKNINDRMSIIETGSDLEKSLKTGITQKQKRKHSSK